MLELFVSVFAVCDYTVQSVCASVSVCARVFRLVWLMVNAIQSVLSVTRQRRSRLCADR